MKFVSVNRKDKGNITNYESFDALMLKEVHANINMFENDIIEREYNEKKHYVEWSCYSCKAPISIDINHILRHGQNIDHKKFYCEKCLENNLIYKKDSLFLRNIGNLYNKIRSIIVKNSGIEDLV